MVTDMKEQTSSPSVPPEIFEVFRLSVPPEIFKEFFEIMEDVLLWRADGRHVSIYGDKHASEFEFRFVKEAADAGPAGESPVAEVKGE